MGNGFEGERGKVLAKNRNGALHLRTIRSDGWTETDRATFLDHLAGTCNVDDAAKTAGHNAQSARALRRRDTEFRDLWDAALETGYAMLEASLLSRAQQVVGQAPVPAETGEGAGAQPFDDMTTRDAMELLERHKRTIIRIRQGKEAGHAGKTATAKETYMAIVERMAVLKIRLDDERADVANKEGGE